MYGVLRILYFFIAYRKSLGCKLSWKCLDWDKINLIPSDQVPPTPWLTEAVCLRQLESTADLLRSVSATSHTLETLRAVPEEGWSTFHSRRAGQFSLIKLIPLGQLLKKNKLPASSPFLIKCRGIQQIKGPSLYCSDIHQINLVRWSPPELWRLFLQARAFVRLENFC